MYYYVREGCFEVKKSEGFCQELTVTSEMLNGEAIVDGWYHVDLSIGDKFQLTAGPEY